ncbi:MAG: 23S rRNA (pseudouridine(1915)-N(3))-methyltransferase RlmH [Bacteroidales bacterium]|nr:23S rRNA (pseudouridine(1915)-N(3))-methyltransferase RlmH [Bacteroidales bacterium]
MKILILVVGRTSTDYLRRGIDLYLDRLSHYLPVEMKVIADVKPSKTSLAPERQKELEGEAILSQLTAGDRLVLLDEKGEELTSRQLAARLEKISAQGSCRRLVYAIGGPYGFSEAVYRKAQGLLSLSRMTFSHEMVRLFFVEQLYRAMTIIRGEPYHHD